VRCTPGNPFALLRHVASSICEKLGLISLSVDKYKQITWRQKPHQKVFVGVSNFFERDESPLRALVPLIPLECAVRRISAAIEDQHRRRDGGAMAISGLREFESARIDPKGPLCSVTAKSFVDSKGPRAI
jgi:hypothetical protein